MILDRSDTRSRRADGWPRADTRSSGEERAITHRARSALLIGLTAASWVIASPAPAQAANDNSNNKGPKKQGGPPAATAPGPAVQGPVAPGPAAQEQPGPTQQGPTTGTQGPRGKTPGTSSPLDIGTPSTLGPASRPPQATPTTARPAGFIGPGASVPAAGPRRTVTSTAVPSTVVPSTVVPRSTVPRSVVTVQPRSVVGSRPAVAARRVRSLPGLENRPAPAAPVATVLPRPVQTPAAPERIAAAVVPVVRDLAEKSAQHAAVPLSLLAVVLLFLLLQHRIDARDPKLAGAALAPEPDLGFGTPVRRTSGPWSGAALS